MEQVIQGRRLGPEERALVGYWLATEPTWNRTRLSRELCRRWNWRNEAGRLKDMACRTLLLKLERQGVIRFDDIRALLHYHCFPSWEAMLDFMMRGAPPLWHPKTPNRHLRSYCALLP